MQCSSWTNDLTTSKPVRYVHVALVKCRVPGTCNLKDKSSLTQPFVLRDKSFIAYAAIGGHHSRSLRTTCCTIAVTTLRRPCGIEYCGCVCVCFMLILMFCPFACKIYERINEWILLLLSAMPRPCRAAEEMLTWC